ncbi:transposase [Sellimonas catena]
MTWMPLKMQWPIDYSNGFVEGTNSRLKMIKRTMYGKCNRELLEAKLRYMRQE